MARGRGGRVRMYIEGDSSDIEAAAKRSERAIGGIDDATKRYNATAGQQSAIIEKVNQRNFALTTSTQRVNRETDTLSKRLQDVNIKFTSMRNLVSLVKWPALATGAGYAAQGIGTLAAGATSLTSALAPLSGALTAYPALLGAVGQAAGVLALTQMGDLKEALGGNEDALKRLSPAARGFMGTIQELEPAAKRLRESVQEDLFTGLTKGLRRAGDNFSVVERVMRRTAGTMGNLAERAGALLGSKAFGRDLQRVGEGNARVLGRLGVAGLKLGSALRHVMVAAQPFLGWLTGSAVKFADWVDGAAKAGRESGRLSAFFGRTREVMERLGSITQSLAAGLMQIGHAAAPLGREILASFDRSAQSFEDWSESMKGKNTLREYFAQAKPAIFEMGRLLRDFAGAFLRISNDKGVFTLTHAIRTDLLPVLEELVTTTTRELGTRFVGLFVEMGKMFGTFAGNSGPLTLFLESLTRVLGGINTLLDKVPGLKSVAVTLVGFAAVSKAMRFTAAITGVKSLIELYRGLSTAAYGAAAAQQAAGAGGMVGVPGGVAPGAGLPGWKGKLARLGMRGMNALPIGVAGYAAGSMVGGPAGGALTGAGAGAVAGSIIPGVGTALGAGIGAAAGAVLSEKATSWGGETAQKFAQSFDSELSPALSKAVSDKRLGKLEGLQRSLRGAINAAITMGASDAEMQPLRDRLSAVGEEIRKLAIPRDAFDMGIAKLTSGLIVRMQDIKKIFRSDLEAINAGWVRGSAGWRNATAKNMNAAIGAIREGMHRGVIEADTGKKEINRLLREIKLVRGDDPLEIARGFRESWRKAGEVNRQNIAQVKRDLSKMPRDSREAAVDAMVGMARALEGKGDLVKGSADRLRSALTTRFGQTNKQLTTGMGKAAKGIAGIFDGLVGAVSTALGNLGTNVNAVLRAFGVTKLVKFGLKVASGAAEAAGKVVDGVTGIFKAGGGWIDGPSRRDSVLAMLGKDEAVLNVHQQPEVEQGLALGKVFGVGRHGSLNELFAGVRRPNHLAEGGFAARVPREVITGPQPLAGMGQRGIDRARAGAIRYLRKHSKAVSPGSIVAIGRQLQRMGYEVGEHPAFGGVSAVHTSGSDHYSNHAIDVNDDAPPYGHGNSEMSSLDWLAKQLKRIPHKQIIWRNRDLDTGAAIDGHMDHLHFAAALGGFARRIFGFARGGRVITGRVSWFNGPASTTASGTPVSKPGLALNLSPGTDAGWDNETTRGWMAAASAGHPVYGRTTIAGHTANLPITDLGPAGSTGRAIDVTEAGVRKLGLDPSTFPTDAIGKVLILGEGGAAASKKAKSSFTPKTGLGQAFGVSIPGLKPGKLTTAAKALPTSIQGLLRQPGLTATDRIEIGQSAMSQAEETEGFDDDVAAAEFLKPMFQRKRGRLTNRLREINKQLRKGGENEKQRRRLLARRKNVQGRLQETRGELRGVNQKLREAEPTERDFADADLARAELTSDRGDDVAALKRLEDIARKDLERAEKSGDPREIAEATRNLKSATDALREAMPSAADFANRDLALAELTAGKEDDREALQKLLSIAEAELATALQTADPRDDIEAAQNVKGLREAVEANNEILKQREEFEKERLEIDKKLAALAETQGPALLAGLISWIDGAIGGPVQLRNAVPATAGVGAGYQ